MAQLHVLVAAHALLARQPEPALADQLHPVAGEPDLADPVARGGAHGGSDVVRILRVDQHDGRRATIAPPDRTRPHTHAAIVPAAPTPLNRLNAARSHAAVAPGASATFGFLAAAPGPAVRTPNPREGP